MRLSRHFLNLRNIVSCVWIKYGAGKIMAASGIHTIVLKLLSFFVTSYQKAQAILFSENLQGEKPHQKFQQVRSCGAKNHQLQGPPCWRRS